MAVKTVRECWKVNQDRRKDSEQCLPCSGTLPTSACSALQGRDTSFYFKWRKLRPWEVKRFTWVLQWQSYTWVSQFWKPISVSEKQKTLSLLQNWICAMYPQIGSIFLLLCITKIKCVFTNTKLQYSLVIIIILNMLPLFPPPITSTLGFTALCPSWALASCEE